MVTNLQMFPHILHLTFIKWMTNVSSLNLNIQSINIFVFIENITLIKIKYLRYKDN